MKQILPPVLLTVILLLSVTQSFAQRAEVSGIVTTPQGFPMEYVNVSLEGTSTGTATNSEGHYKLTLQTDSEQILVFSFLGYSSKTQTLKPTAGEEIRLDVTLEPLATTLPDFEVRDRQVIQSQYMRIDPRLSAVIPGPGSGVESLLKTMPGVSTTTELSSQYSVRGGNFDENLVYVNGIEIYRPFLVRSGQQEGLSFVNSDLVSSITFSSGGFDAQYGDKMASVLDITYRTPEKFAGSFSMSLLEGSLHLEDSRFNDRFKYLFGLRHKSNQYLLGTLDTQGDYKPVFTDFQGLLSYDFNSRWQLSFLGNFSRNQYLFVPQVQRTRFGTVTEVRQFTVYFDGQETDRFLTALGALSLQYRPTERHKLQFNTSLFQTDETESFDILGQYLLERVETDFGSDDFGQPVGTPLGVGRFHNHARNYLNVLVWNAEHKGEVFYENNVLRWGLKYQYEDIFDRLNEWTLTDSAGYVLPRHPDRILLEDTINTRIFLQSSRISGFVQNSWEFALPRGRYIVTAGVRSNYWSYNRQWLVSPRATVLYKPVWAPRMTFRASGGLYQQPAFYKELRDFQGRLNPDIKAQESIQFVLGSEYNMQLWGRPFKYTTEVYYKNFNNLIPYELDNVRIRYYANNTASGYGAGLDMKINGEFVPGIESWASLSLMKTEEKIDGAIYQNPDGTTEPLGYIPRPTDQRLTFSMFFQDFLPRNPSYKVSLAMIYGSGVPLAPPAAQKTRNLGTMRPYRRVDIGFSKEIIGETASFGKDSFFRNIESMWISAEVFNLLEIENVISYLWIRDTANDLYAIPNNLTSRLINIKLVTRF